MNALILMTRVPIPGKTKTRLMEFLTGEECAKLHTRFLLDVFRVCSMLGSGIDIYLTYTPKENLSYMRDIIPSYINIFPQSGNDLGNKMDNAINKVLYKGYEKVILIGTDIPEIQPSYIKKAFYILEDKDVCLGPTEDGGYYLIGMKERYSEIFSNNIRWGKKSVIEGTMDIANRSNKTIGFTHKCCDIDTKSDLIKFMFKVKDKNRCWDIFPKNTYEFVNEILFYKFNGRKANTNR
ncbi:TIGR04282 family arsenosugar biosynthesis glycosyltransferase [Clostridium sp. JNZ X4-2]